MSFVIENNKHTMRQLLIKEQYEFDENNIYYIKNCIK